MKLTHQEGFDRFGILETPDLGRRMPLELAILSFAVIDSHSHYVVAPHRHCEYEAMIPLQGDYVSELNGEGLTVAPGSLLLVQPGDRHAEDCRGAFRFAGIRFTFTDPLNLPWLHPLIAPEFPPRSRLLPLDPAGTPKRLLEVMLADDSSPVRRATVNILAAAFLWELLAEIPETLVSRRLPEALEGNRLQLRLETLFEEFPDGSLTPGRMARELCMSRRTFEHKLRKLFDISPARVYLCHRIRRALPMLRNGCSVKETAEFLGFSNPFHFSRVFKSITGRAPSEFRG